MKLFYREYGSKGQPLIILHGLFGSSDNWMTQAKMLSDEYRVYVLDQRNHGQSPHSDEFDYDLLADDLHNFITTNAIASPVILGHSMGGKAAMYFALAHPELVSKLVVADMSPRAYAVHHDKILEGLISLPINTIKSRNEADELLSNYVPEPDVRQFLLKNLQRKPEGGFSWKINLDSLDKNIEKIGAAVDTSKKFEKPTLFIHGSKSNYVRDEDLSLIENIFPKSQVVTLDTGHWIQAEKPKEFVEAVVNFLKEA
jgi:esterase